MKLANKSALLCALLAMLSSCTSGNGGSGGGGGTEEEDAGPEEPTTDEWDDRLAERVVDYSAALRKAALRLTGDLPTLDEILSVAGAADDNERRTIYEGLVQDYMDRPEFARAVFAWWQDTLKLGDDPEFDQAAAFAAQVTVENRSYTELLAASAGQCGSFDSETAVFTAADCDNGVAEHAGLLTHPAPMKQFYSNMAFRRVDWIQKTFVCTKFPAEFAATPTDVGASQPYTGLWAFESVPSLAEGRIDFRDTSSVVCANCHTTMNHIAPLFAYFDDNGQYNAEMVVLTPLEGSPVVEPSDYLIGGEPLAWRYGGVETPTVAALGQAMAQDPAIAECAIARAWNWALGKGDVVDALREVPTDIIADQIAAFTTNEYRFKDAIYAVFTSDDFVRF